MADEVRVDPAVLHGVAGGMDLITGDLDTAVQGMETGSAAFRDRLPGWALPAFVADAAQGVWHGDGKAAHIFFDRYARGLRGCARDYEVSDHANSGHFQEQ